MAPKAAAGQLPQAVALSTQTVSAATGDVGPKHLSITGRRQPVSAHPVGSLTVFEDFEAEDGRPTS